MVETAGSITEDEVPAQEFLAIPRGKNVRSGTGDWRVRTGTFFRCPGRWRVPWTEPHRSGTNPIRSETVLAISPACLDHRNRSPSFLFQIASVSSRLPLTCENCGYAEPARTGRGYRRSCQAARNRLHRSPGVLVFVERQSLGPYLFDVFQDLGHSLGRGFRISQLCHDQVDGLLSLQACQRHLSIGGIGQCNGLPDAGNRS